MRTRLDEALVERGLVPSRSRARDVIRRGHVRVDDGVVTQPAALVGVASRLTVAPESGVAYVSRGALKLGAALDAFGFDPKDRTALDAGASTGGFTEVLLQRGARRVTAVDVGHDQLHASLRAHPLVVVLEGRDIRTLSRDDIGGQVDAIVADLSFISLTKVLPALFPLAASGAWLIALVKPQFEVGREGIGKGGIVRSEALAVEAVETITAMIAATAGWRVIGQCPSPIEGGSGNREFLIGAIYDG